MKETSDMNDEREKYISYLISRRGMLGALREIADIAKASSENPILRGANASIASWNEQLALELDWLIERMNGMSELMHGHARRDQG